MFFHVQLEKNIRLHPRNFGPQLHQTLKQKLSSEVEGQCTGRYGYIITVTSISHIGQGKIAESSGYATFLVKYRAIVMRTFKSEIVDAVVTRVTKIGFFASVGPLEIFISRHGIPTDMTFDPDSSPPRYIAEDQNATIAQDTEVRLKIMGTKIEANGLFAIGTIKEDYLGPIAIEQL
ncbi:DNA-directed RNA polymerase II subunit RPB7 [Acrasis kona]|uniref:DNA-directed RNA polymerase II subunit RPB7 n=1 Tax=Acrasis kona TaxID=1008807 RepID=A0AAW2ZEV2_9EUKA